MRKTNLTFLTYLIGRLDLTRFNLMAIRTGLEPVASSVTGLRDNQLHQRTIAMLSFPAVNPVCPAVLGILKLGLLPTPAAASL